MPAVLSQVSVFLIPTTSHISILFLVVFLFDAHGGACENTVAFTLFFPICLDCSYAPFNMATSLGRSQLHFNMAQGDPAKGPPEQHIYRRSMHLARDRVDRGFPY